MPTSSLSVYYTGVLPVYQLTYSLHIARWSTVSCPCPFCYQMILFMPAQHPLVISPTHNLTLLDTQEENWPFNPTKYKVGTVFIGTESSFGYIHLQTSLNAEQTITGKKVFEWEMSKYGRAIIAYHADNGIFADNAFKSIHHFLWCWWASPKYSGRKLYRSSLFECPCKAVPCYSIMAWSYYYHALAFCDLSL